MHFLHHFSKEQVLGTDIQIVHICKIIDSLKDTSSLEQSYDKPRQHIKKQRHYLTTKVCLVKVMVFPVVMCGSESWTIKKAECQRIDAFEL